MGYYYHLFISKQTKTVSLALYHGARHQVITWACCALRRIIFLPVYNYICLRLITCVNLSRRPLRRFYWVYFKRRGAQQGGRPLTVKNKLTLGACARVCVGFTLIHCRTSTKSWRDSLPSCRFTYYTLSKGFKTKWCDWMEHSFDLYNPDKNSTLSLPAFHNNMHDEFHPWWCHKGQCNLSQVSGHTSSLMLTPPSTRSTCFCLLPSRNRWFLFSDL